jgi:hypothetical protein
MKAVVVACAYGTISTVAHITLGLLSTDDTETMKAKPRTRSPERWRRADHNFAVATIALMVFFLAAGFTGWMFAKPGTAAANPPAPHADTR